jgi:hypothetical protein
LMTDIGIKTWINNTARKIREILNSGDVAYTVY